MKADEITKLRKGLWVARVGSLRVEAPTKQEALNGLKKQARQRLEFEPDPPQMVVNSDRIFVFLPHFEGGINVFSYTTDGTRTSCSSWVNGTMESVMAGYRESQ